MRRPRVLAAARRCGMARDWPHVCRVVLLGAFPVVYATLFSACISRSSSARGTDLRGVAFRVCVRDRASDGSGTCSVAGGSFVAAFIQVLMSALVEGLPISDGHDAGGEFGCSVHSRCSEASGLVSVNPASALCWLCAMQGRSPRPAYRYTLSVDRLLLFLILVFAYALVENLRNHEPLAGTALLFVLSAIWDCCGDRTRCKRSSSPR